MEEQQDTMSDINQSPSPVPRAPHEPVTYILDTYTDRERLYTQYELFRSDFNSWFDRALQLGNLSTNPESSRWRVLDVGCGEGLFAAEILNRYPHARVVGFDKDAQAVTTAQLVFKGQGDLHFYVHDAVQPLPDEFEPEVGGKRGEKFDIAFAHIVLMHIRDAATVLANIAAALKPGGVIYLRDSPTDPLQFPHPSLAALCAVTGTALQLITTPNFARVHDAYLLEAGFTEVESGTTTYVVGGPTREGQRMLSNVVSGVRSARTGLVDGLQLISGSEFDEHLRRFTSEVTPDLTCNWELINTIGCKPTGG